MVWFMKLTVTHLFHVAEDGFDAGPLEEFTWGRKIRHPCPDLRGLPARSATDSGASARFDLRRRNPLLAPAGRDGGALASGALLDDDLRGGQTGSEFGKRQGGHRNPLSGEDGEEKLLAKIQRK